MLMRWSLCQLCGELAEQDYHGSVYYDENASVSHLEKCYGKQNKVFAFRHKGTGNGSDQYTQCIYSKTIVYCSL